jgi:hypothetical protein
MTKNLGIEIAAGTTRDLTRVYVAELRAIFSGITLEMGVSGQTAEVRLRRVCRSIQYPCNGRLDWSSWKEEVVR